MQAALPRCGCRRLSPSERPHRCGLSASCRASFTRPSFTCDSHPPCTACACAAHYRIAATQPQQQRPTPRSRHHASWPAALPARLGSMSKWQRASARRCLLVLPATPLVRLAGRSNGSLNSLTQNLSRVTCCNFVGLILSVSSAQKLQPAAIQTHQAATAAAVEVAVRQSGPAWVGRSGPAPTVKGRASMPCPWPCWRARIQRPTCVKIPDLHICMLI